MLSIIWDTRGYFFWLLMLFNVLIPQLIWIKRVRTSVPALFLIALSVLYGMWLERYVIIVVSLHRDFLPSAWGMYSGTVWDYATLAGSIGLFLTLMFLFIRLLPMISIFEMRGLVRPGRAACVRHSGGTGAARQNRLCGPMGTSGEGMGVIG